MRRSVLPRLSRDVLERRLSCSFCLRTASAHKEMVMVARTAHSNEASE